jgi:hypothetical protein
LGTGGHRNGSSEIGISTFRLKSWSSKVDVNAWAILESEKSTKTSDLSLLISANKKQIKVKLKNVFIIEMNNNYLWRFPSHIFTKPFGIQIRKLCKVWWIKLIRTLGMMPRNGSYCI